MRDQVKLLSRKRNNGGELAEDNSTKLSPKTSFDVFAIITNTDQYFVQRTGQATPAMSSLSMLLYVRLAISSFKLLKYLEACHPACQEVRTNAFLQQFMRYELDGFWPHWSACVLPFCQFQQDVLDVASLRGQIGPSSWRGLIYLTTLFGIVIVPFLKAFTLAK